MQQTASATPSRQERRVRRTRAMILAGFIQLMQQKPVKDISVRELADLVDINRSTFYLHYETMADLLSESVSHMNEQFLTHMKKDTDAFVTKLWDCPLDELYLITPEYLTPYLDYIEQHKLLFRTATENAAVLGMDKSYERMFRHVFTPILDRYGIPQQDRPYLMAFYIQGLMAIISEWLKNDCTDSVADVVNVIQRCVKRRREEI